MFPDDPVAEVQFRETGKIRAIDKGAQGRDRFGGALDQLAQRAADQLVSRLREPARESRVGEAPVRGAHGDTGGFGCLLKSIFSGRLSHAKDHR